jgi:hypothetical protein
MTSTAQNGPNAADTPPSSSGSPPGPASPFHEALNGLKDRAHQIVANEAEADWLPAMRNLAGHLGVDADVRDADLRAYLAEAVAAAAPKGVGITKGEVIDLTPIPWAWDGLLMAQRLNLLIAQPKVGKTSLLLSMVAAWHRGESFLGRRFIGPCPPVVIVGTDQSLPDWGHMLKPLGLLSDQNALADPIEVLWTAADPLHLNEQGLETLAERLSQYDRPLLILDSYHACVSHLQIEDSGSAYANPLNALLVVCAQTNATACVIHHANKGGGSLISSSRGTTALTAVPSQLLHMAYLKGDDQPDKRITLKTMGRSGHPASLLIERTDAGWTLHGDGGEVEAAEQLQEAIDSLEGRQADLYDHICSRWDLMQQPAAAIDVAKAMDLASNKVTRYLKRLEKQGLIEACGKTDTTASKGRPSTLYRPVQGDLSPSLKTGCERDERCEKDGANPENGSRVYEKSIFSPFSPFKPMYERGGLNHPPSDAPVNGQPCLRVLPSGEHQPGWLIADASNPHAITIEKLGQSTYRVRNLRWGADLLPADSPFPAPPAAESQPSASIPSDPPSTASEPHTAAAEDHPYGF